MRPRTGFQYMGQKSVGQKSVFTIIVRSTNSFEGVYRRPKTSSHNFLVHFVNGVLEIIDIILNLQAG